MTLSPRGLFINLDDNTERLKSFNTTKDKYALFKNVERFSAIRHEVGAIGCTQSHLACFKQLYADASIGDDDPCIIAEDDFYIFDETVYKNFEQSLKAVVETKQWDVITMTPVVNFLVNINRPFPELASNGFVRVGDAQTMSGYIVRKRFLPKLIELFETYLPVFIETRDVEKYSCDQIWKKLQRDNLFICYNRAFAGQIPCYSNLIGKFVDYTMLFKRINNMKPY